MLLWVSSFHYTKQLFLVLNQNILRRAPLERTRPVVFISGTQRFFSIASDSEGRLLYLMVAEHLLLLLFVTGDCNKMGVDTT